MGSRKQWFRAVKVAVTGLVLGGFFALEQASAATLKYAFSNLADESLGDLWQVVYQVEGPLQEAESLNVLFPADSYASLELVSSVDADLIVPTITSPIPQLPADGQLLLTATENLTDNFSTNISVKFIWQGVGSPGAQSYEHLDSTFGLISVGMTSPVPEPSSSGLMAGGLILAAILGLLRTRTHSEHN